MRERPGQWDTQPRLPMSHQRKQRTRDAARDLRQRSTRSEDVLWRALRGQSLGAKFRRQQPVGPFVVDFFCAPTRLIVELDGEVHDDAEQQALDTERQDLLESLGYRILRLRNEEVLNDLPRTLNTIKQALRPTPGIPPLPLRERGRG